jgi:hypothetical protein
MGRIPDRTGAGAGLGVHRSLEAGSDGRTDSSSGGAVLGAERVLGSARSADGCETAFGASAAEIGHTGAPD